MPSLGADMTDATLVEQLVSPGDAVQRGDIIAAVETQKGVIEIEAFEDGILDNWLVDIGTNVAVGTPLAMIREKGESAAAAPAIPDIAPPKPAPPKPAPPKPAPPKPGPPDTPIPDDRPRRRISPAARRLAVQTGIDPSTVATRSGAPITRSDIAMLTQNDRPPAQTDMRTAIAAAMTRSKRDIPHYYLSHTVDLTNAQAFVSAENADRAPDDRLLLGALYLKAIANAVVKVPEMNGHFTDDGFHQSDAVHTGLAISLRSGGLVAPAIFNADTQRLDDLMTSMRDLITRVRAGRFRARELSDATITLTSLGDRGVDRLYGIIYPPQVAIVGIGTPAMRPWVHDEQVAARLTATVTLAADHRVSDGRRGALFLNTIDKNLQTPDTL